MFKLSRGQHVRGGVAVGQPVASPCHRPSRRGLHPRAGRVAQGLGARLWGRTWCSWPGHSLCPPQRGLGAATRVWGARASPELQTTRAAGGVTRDGVQHGQLPRPGLASTLCPPVCSHPAETPSPRWGPGRAGCLVPHGRLAAAQGSSQPVETRPLETQGPLRPGHSLLKPPASLKGALPSRSGVEARYPRCSGPARTPKETATG